MMKARMFSIAVILAVGVCSTAVMAQQKSLDSDCAICEMKNSISNAGVEVFLDARLRQTWRDNMKTLDGSALDHNDLYQRIRGRAGVTIKPVDWMSFGTRLVTEWRHFCKPDYKSNGDPYDASPDVDAIFDQMFVKLDGGEAIPVVITVGRQNISLPSKWLIFDGTPLDGSRTLFFDAGRLTLNLESAMDTTVDIIGIRNRAESDAYIKPFNYDNAEGILSESDEEGLVAYLSSKGIVPQGELDGYFIYTHREGYNTDTTGNTSNNKADIYTAGTRVAGKVADSPLKYSLEGAIQFGRRENIVAGAYQPSQDKNIDGAFGINSLVSYDIGGTFSPEAHVGYEYRSGDGDSGKGFDVLWGRYPSFSELFQGGFDRLDGAQPAGANNFHRINLGGGWKPFTDVSWLVNYHLLIADNPNLETAAVHSDNCLKGHLFTTQIKWKHNEHLSSRVSGELFLPGGYYSDDNNDTATFARYELTVKW